MSLVRQACLEGLIDPSKADYLDRNWWKRLRWVLDYIEERNIVKWKELNYNLHRGAMGHSSSHEHFKVHWDQAVEILDKIWADMFPWMPKDDRQSAIKRMTEEWQRQYGRMDDPDTQRRIRETVTQMLEVARKGREQNLFGG